MLLSPTSFLVDGSVLLMIGCKKMFPLLTMEAMLLGMKRALPISSKRRMEFLLGFPSLTRFLGNVTAKLSGMFLMGSIQNSNRLVFHFLCSGSRSLFSFSLPFLSSLPLSLSNNPKKKNTGGEEAYCPCQRPNLQSPPSRENCLECLVSF